MRRLGVTDSNPFKSRQRESLNTNVKSGNTSKIEKTPLPKLGDVVAVFPGAKGASLDLIDKNTILFRPLANA